MFRGSPDCAPQGGVGVYGLLVAVLCPRWLEGPPALAPPLGMNTRLSSVVASRTGRGSNPHGPWPWFPALNWPTGWIDESG